MLRVCAVSYLNTAPLVWGMLHGPQQGIFDLSFEVPSVCAARVREGAADIGIVPVATLLEQNLTIFRGTGIACRGPVRTILLISKKPFSQIGVLAVDSGSRTSVMLSRLILQQAYRAQPALITMEPELRPMLDAADAALIIGDPALLLDPDKLRSGGLQVADLGAEWTRISGLPMVFAVWAGHPEAHTAARERVFIESYKFGAGNIENIISAESARRGIPAKLAREYLTRHIVFELGEAEYKGMEAFLKAAAAMPAAEFIEVAGMVPGKTNL